MTRDTFTYGFDKPTAEALAAQVRLGDREHIEGLVRRKGGTGVTFHVFQLTSAVTTGTPSSATCTLLDPDDESTTTESGVTIYMSLAMFDDLQNGDKGTALKISGTTWAIGAPCTQGTVSASASFGYYLG